MADLIVGDVTVTLQDRWQTGRKRHSEVDINFGDGVKTYPAGGVPLPTFTSFAFQLFLDFLNFHDPASAGGLMWKYDKANNKLRAYRTASFVPIFTGTSPATLPINLIHLVAAATVGIQLLAHEGASLKSGRSLGFLEFVSPTNIDGSGLVASGSTAYVVEDNDSAVIGGVPIFFDEDAGVEEERLLINNPTLQDILIVLQNGSVINLKHDVNAASVGIQVFFDEDAVNFERLLFVSPTTTNGTAKTDGDIKLGKDAVSGTINAVDAANLVELTNVAVPAQAFKAEAIGR